LAIWGHPKQTLAVSEVDMAKIKPVTNPCVLPKTAEGQVLKVAQELLEAIEAIFKGDWEHADEEMMDVVIAGRTYFHKRNYTDEQVDDLYNKVEQKNAKRNYYAE